MEQEKKQRTKRQHILPQSYLRRFSIKDQVWVHNFQKKASYVNNIKDAACIDDFYTVQTHDYEQDDIIESEILAKIEGIGNPIIEKMINGMCIPDGHEKALFCNYLAIMYTRGLWFRQILSEVHEHFANELAEKLITDKKMFESTMKELRQEIDLDYDFTFEQAKEVYEKSNIGMKIPRTYYVKEMMLYAAPMVNIFYRMNFNLIYIPPMQKNKFITSDKPIVPVSSDQTGEKYQNWLQDPDVSLYFPLSSHTCLMIDKKKQPMILSGSRRNIASINGVMSNDCVSITISEKEKYTWLRENQTVSDSMDEIFELFIEDKTEIPRVSSVYGKKLRSKPHNKVNKLKGKDD